MEKAKAPFKRGQMLDYKGVDFPPGVVKYVKWWGFHRSALMIVKLADGREVTVRVDECKPTTI